MFLPNGVKEDGECEIMIACKYSIREISVGDDQSFSKRRSPTRVRPGSFALIVSRHFPPLLFTSGLTRKQPRLCR